MKNLGIILAAGKGRRFGGADPKQYSLVYNRPVIAYSLESFNKSSFVDELAVVTAKQDVYRLKEILKHSNLAKPVIIVKGGRERWESVYNALVQVSDQEIGLVAIHDSARPMTDEGLVDRVFMAASNYGAAAAGMPVKDTIKQVDHRGFVENTPDRSMLWQVQTPQCFKYSLIMDAYRQALNPSINITDDCMLVEGLGHPVKMVRGGYENIKITTQEDLVFAEHFLKMRG